MREKRSLKKVAAIGTIGWTTSIAFFLRLQGHLSLSISISRLAGNPRTLARSLDPLRKRCLEEDDAAESVVVVVPWKMTR